ncbi:MAG: polyphosphate kinase 1 [Cytophagales bacterium]|nr:polyphosphate kinase 1 [Cytophagales bacterium]
MTVPLPILPLLPLLDRDQSILQFNERVLQWARADDVPLLERLRFLCIVSSNLDEFFEVRMEQHHAVAKQLVTMQAGESKQHCDALSISLHRVVEKQYKLFNEQLIPALDKQGIHVLSHGDRNAAQRRWVKNYFEREVRPLLIPVGLDPSHPFPQVANKSLNFIVRLKGKDAFGRENVIAIVKVPRVLPRLILLPDKVGCKDGHGISVVALSSVIRAHLADLFPGREPSEFSQFRVTRNSELALDEEDVRDLRTALRQSLQHRNYGQAVRLEVSSGCSHFLSNFLLSQFDLPRQALYSVHGPVNLSRFAQLIDLASEPRLLFPPYQSAWPASLNAQKSIFTELSEKDVLIHQPFESFDAVLALLREGVNDPAVLSIRLTVYRTGADSEMMDLLREAVRRGKEVLVVVELKARFDEEANINWAEALESIGAQVVYGVVGLKTHCKMLLLTRKEGRNLRRYGHLSTGNYNARTAKLYTDVGYLTADPDLTRDMQAVFVHLASQTKLLKLEKLWVAPFHLQDKLLAMIAETGRAAAKGVQGRIVLKMNALTDEGLTRALILAGQQGVQIDLIVRGACILPAQQAGVTDNIRVRSVVGRFLEHSRVFYFRSGEQESLYLASADLMNRNMLRRIEVAWPVTDALLRQRIIDECLVAYLYDTKDAWILGADGQYTLAGAKLDPSQQLSAQYALMRRYG